MSAAVDKLLSLSFGSWFFSILILLMNKNGSDLFSVLLNKIFLLCQVSCSPISQRICC